VSDPDAGPLVLLERPRPEVALVTLNRPDRLNALSFALVAALHDVLDAIQRDHTCRVVVLTVPAAASARVSSSPRSRIVHRGGDDGVARARSED
jgi:1,4-dihydroxy-2-naphthoyl-CoA synthase